MTEPDVPDDLPALVAEFLADSVAANKRRAAIRQGRREPMVEGCPHAAWNTVRNWCEDCGATKAELAS